MPENDEPMLDITTVAVEQTTKDALKRKKKEFNHRRANETVLELVKMHDLLPDWLGSGSEAKRFLKDLDDFFPADVNSLEEARAYLHEVQNRESE